MRAGIALGSNLGDRRAHLRTARERLLNLHEGDPSEALVSPIYETEPVDCPPGSEPFLNGVIEIETSLFPAELLRQTQAIESDLGRPEVRSKNAPRPIDLDLLYIGDEIVDSPELQLPHPRITERLFVLKPLADIRPDLILPGQSEPVSSLLENKGIDGS